MSVVVYLKNGEKAPLLDANYVKLEPGTETAGVMLRCLFGDREVGLFKWDEVAGYTIEVLRSLEGSTHEAWGARQDA
jgi:hypothetical protein